MTITKNYKLLLAVGILLIGAGTILKIFVTVPDFFDGFMKGLGLVLVIFSFIRISKRRSASR